jgi:cytochrome c oxidase subunit 2
VSQDIAPHGQSESARVAEVAERRWAVVAVVIIVAMAVLAAVAGVHRATMPQAIVETINPVTLHLGGEFVESNLGSAIEPDGTVTVRAIGQQYSFTPQCMVVPTDTRINFRATSPDVVHGFLIEGTTINTMLVPGYVATISARFDKPGDHLMPCQEFCGVGHEGMWAKVKVLDKAEFLKLSASKPRLSCVE